MTRTRILKEEKWVKIESKPIYLSGHGFSETINGVVFCYKPYISDEDCQQEMQRANEEYMNMNQCWRPQQPELTIYWQVVKQEILDGKEEKL